VSIKLVSRFDVEDRELSAPHARAFGDGDATATAKAAPTATDARAAGCHWLHVDFEPELTGFYLGPCGFTSTAAGLLRLDGGLTD
jgi:hypothetical protein